MSHFAKIENGVVTQVIVADQDVIDSGVLGGIWVQTSYNTRAGVHLSGGVPLRHNYAGIGYSYDATRDAFIPPQPYPSWTLNEATCQWDSPIPYPTDGQRWVWDEAAQWTLAPA